MHLRGRGRPEVHPRARGEGRERQQQGQQPAQGTPTHCAAAVELVWRLVTMAWSSSSGKMLYGFAPSPKEAAATIFAPPLAARSIFCAELLPEATVKRKLSRARTSCKIDVPLGNVNALLSAVSVSPLVVTSEGVLSPRLIPGSGPCRGAARTLAAWASS